jgi:hypothetical protein
MELPEFARLRLLDGPKIEKQPFRVHGTPEEEAADEAAWAESFAKSRDLLARMAVEADEEDRLGLTVPLDMILRG